MRVKPRFLVGLAEAVPGAYLLADVAAKHPIIEFAAHVGGNGVFELDGEVADAAATVDLVGGDGVGRTSVDAAGTCATVVFDGAIRPYQVPP